MYFDLKGLKLAIIGGGDPCREILDRFAGPDLRKLNIQVLMVADTIEISKGILRARELNIPTSKDYHAVCNLSGLDLILKLKNDDLLSCILEKVNTERVSIIDLDTYGAMSFLQFLKTEEEKIRIRQRLEAENLEKEKVADLFELFPAGSTRLRKTGFLFWSRSARTFRKLKKS